MSPAEAGLQILLQSFSQDPAYWGDDWAAQPRHHLSLQKGRVW